MISILETVNLKRLIILDFFPSNTPIKYIFFISFINTDLILKS